MQGAKKCYLHKKKLRGKDITKAVKSVLFPVAVFFSLPGKHYDI